MDLSRSLYLINSAFTRFGAFVWRLPTYEAVLAAPDLSPKRFRWLTIPKARHLNVGNVIKSGPTAQSGIGAGCGTTEVPAHSQNTLLTVNLPPLVTTGVINTNADGEILQKGTLEATATADTHDAVLLGGLITADEVKAVSTITHDSGGFHSSAAGSTLVTLSWPGT